MNYVKIGVFGRKVNLFVRCLTPYRTLVILYNDSFTSSLIMYLLLIVPASWETGSLSYFHPDILTGKVWVQEGATDLDPVGELERKGVPKKNSILAFQALDKCSLSGYAVG